MSSSGNLFVRDFFTSNLEYYQATNDTKNSHFRIQKASRMGIRHAPKILISGKRPQHQVAQTSYGSNGGGCAKEQRNRGGGGWLGRRGNERAFFCRSGVAAGQFQPQAFFTFCHCPVVIS